MAEVGQLLKRARRTAGRKILICHEFFFDRDLLARLGLFDQLAFAGDPRQPGTGDARHLFEFFREIGGQKYTLQIVWRVGHPLSTMAANFFAYGSRFKLCARPFSKEDRQFDLIECDDTASAIAESMLSYALDRSRQGKSVIIAAACLHIVAAVRKIIRSLADVPANIQCRYLSDLQGREADMLVIDLHDVASSHPRPDEALRVLIMLLGRVRQTTCIILGKRNMAVDRGSALPMEVFFGALLRYRVRSTENNTFRRSGSQFDAFSEDYTLHWIDEETIKIGEVNGNFVNIALVRTRSSHNVAMMKGHHCLIEAPTFFTNDTSLEHEISILHRLMKDGHIPGTDVYSFAAIEDFLIKRGARAFDR